MKWNQIADRLNHSIQEHKIGILGTIFFHIIVIFSFVLFEVAVSEPAKQNSFDIEFEPEIDLSAIDLSHLQENEAGVDEANPDLKNIAVNETENKSFEDYSQELEQELDKIKNQKLFQAEDYEDKRNLVKDYSQDPEYLDQLEKPDQNQTKTNKVDEPKNSYGGNTIISYNLPGRKATRLPVPAYQCLGSGTVKIEVSVNQKGYVVSSRIISASTPSGETCLPNAAIEASKHSRFNIDLNTQISKGTITYQFIAQ